MPSRKRAKGRERKLKQQAREPVERSVSQPPPTPNGENTNLPEQSTRRIEQAENVKCKHGYVHDHQKHPVNSFMDSFADAFNCKICEIHNMQTMKESMKMTFEKHREVWEDDAMRKMVIDRIVSFGTDCIIKECTYYARTIIVSILLLENYDGEGIFQSALSKGTEDMAYLLNAQDRDVVHFFKKRIPCSCLDEKYSELKKSQVRGSECYHCKQTIKRKAVKTCSRCKCVQYCSKECQKKDWPSHKEQCILHSRFHEDVEKAESAYVKLSLIQERMKKAETAFKKLLLIQEEVSSVDKVTK